MYKYLKINIANKDCKGISLEVPKDSKAAPIKNATEANSIIGDSYRLRLTIRVGAKTFRKSFTFVKKAKTFIKAVEEVASQREIIRAEAKEKGTLRKAKPTTTTAAAVVKPKLYEEEVEQFLEYKENTKALRPKTLANYERGLLLHCKGLKGKNIHEITTEDVKASVDALYGSISPATIAMDITALRLFFNHAKVTIDWDDIDVPKVDNKKEYHLSLKDSLQIMEAMEEYSKFVINGNVGYEFPEVRHIFKFLLEGRRIGEVLKLKYSDINFTEHEYVLRKETTKAKRSMDFRLTEKLEKALIEHAEVMGISNPEKNIYFTDEQRAKEKPIFTLCGDTIRRHFQKMLKELKLPKLRLHDVRHMLASTLIQNQTAIQDVSRMLGHSSIAITEKRYVTKSKEQASRAVDNLEELRKAHKAI